MPLLKRLVTAAVLPTFQALLSQAFSNGLVGTGVAQEVVAA